MNWAVSNPRSPKLRQACQQSIARRKQYKRGRERDSTQAGCTGRRLRPPVIPPCCSRSPYLRPQGKVLYDPLTQAARASQTGRLGRGARNELRLRVLRSGAAEGVASGNPRSGEGFRFQRLRGPPLRVETEVAQDKKVRTDSWAMVSEVAGLSGSWKGEG